MTIEMFCDKLKSLKLDWSLSEHKAIRALANKFPSERRMCPICAVAYEQGFDGGGLCANEAGALIGLSEFDIKKIVIAVDYQIHKIDYNRKLRDKLLQICKL